MKNEDENAELREQEESAARAEGRKARAIAYVETAISIEYDPDDDLDAIAERAAQCIRMVQDPTWFGPDAPEGMAIDCLTLDEITHP